MSLWSKVQGQLNFYRLHLLFFTLTPLIFSAIFYASNGRYYIAYIDALYNSVSAMTVCGLTTVDLSSLTGWQQVILFIQMSLGSPVVVSWVMVYVRRYYFAKKLDHIINNNVIAATEEDPQAQKTTHELHPSPSSEVDNEDEIILNGQSSSNAKIDKSMIRRMDYAPKRIDPNSVVSEAGEKFSPSFSSTQPMESSADTPKSLTLRRTRTTASQVLQHTNRPQFSSSLDQPPSHYRHRSPLTTGFGGFPGPHRILVDLFREHFPRFHGHLHRTLTIPRTATYAPEKNGQLPNARHRSAPYLSFDAVVGRNSVFTSLTKEQFEELGGVEFRALKALLWMIAGYYVGLQLLAFIVIAPYISSNEWRTNFEEPSQHRQISPPWFAAFEVASAFTNSGMSLVDQSMVPFQKAYVMIVFLIVLILGGNTAYPIFFRFTVWITYRLVPKQSRIRETFRFLLDHPRRCYIYLFPSHQTWFLVTVVLFLNATDWFFFLILDIGNPAINSIPLGVRFFIGLLQATSVRAAGFGTVPLSVLAPAVKVLYIVMMYVSVYPIAMSVRSTNVYEEQSLGVFRQEEEDEDEEDFKPEGSRMVVWSRYLAMHARKQLAFDMWWLGLALFLVCIIERDNLEDNNQVVWFNIFSIMFELVSAYGSVGLSLGIPTANYSFSGALRPLSKLIICAVMIRGRHRGLPVAIDRAVMLPAEFRSRDEMQQLGGDNEGGGDGRTETPIDTNEGSNRPDKEG